MKKGALVLTVVGALAALVIGGTVVLADEPATSNSFPDLTELRERIRGTVDDWLGTAIENGSVTEEQAARITGMADRFGVKSRGGKLPGGQGALSEEMQAFMESYRATSEETLAGLLNMSVEELETARQDRTFNLADAAEAAGTDIDTIKEALQAELDELVAQAVADGTLTQEQADRLSAMPLSGLPVRELPRMGWSERPQADAVITDWLKSYRESIADDVTAAREQAQAALKAAVNAAVEAGELTQAQADTILSGNRGFSGEMPSMPFGGMRDRMDGAQRGGRH